MKVYRLYITENAIDRRGSWDKIIWQRNVRASGRAPAVGKCLPEIRRKVLSRIKDGTIKSIPVYCGERTGPNRANRMTPIRVSREGKIRA